jgi:hypothetical protein
MRKFLTIILLLNLSLIINQVHSTVQITAPSPNNIDNLDKLITYIQPLVRQFTLCPDLYNSIFCFKLKKTLEIKIGQEYNPGQYIRELFKVYNKNIVDLEKQIVDLEKQVDQDKLYLDLSPEEKNQQKKLLSNKEDLYKMKISEKIKTLLESQDDNGILSWNNDTDDQNLQEFFNKTLNNKLEKLNVPGVVKKIEGNLNKKNFILLSRQLKHGSLELNSHTSVIYKAMNSRFSKSIIQNNKLSHEAIEEFNDLLQLIHEKTSKSFTPIDANTPLSDMVTMFKTVHDNMGKFINKKFTKNYYGKFQFMEAIEIIFHYNNLLSKSVIDLNSSDIQAVFSHKSSSSLEVRLDLYVKSIKQIAQQFKIDVSKLSLILDEFQQNPQSSINEKTFTEILDNIINEILNILKQKLMDEKFNNWVLQDKDFINPTVEFIPDNSQLIKKPVNPRAEYANNINNNIKAEPSIINTSSPQLKESTTKDDNIWDKHQGKFITLLLVGATGVTVKLSIKKNKRSNSENKATAAA